MISDCEMCWTTPCVCGWDYRDWNTDQLESQIKLLKRVLEYKLRFTNIPPTGKEMERAYMKFVRER